MVEGENSISNRHHRARAIRIGGVDAPGFICRVVEQRHRLLMIRFVQQLAYLDESPGAMKVAEFPDLNQLEHSIGIFLIDGPHYHAGVEINMGLLPQVAVLDLIDDVHVYIDTSMVMRA